MSKSLISNSLQDTKDKPYIWDLYFFKIDRRHNECYKSYKIRFSKPDALTNYANKLIDTTIKYKLPEIDKVSKYDGYNTKVSCDKISTNDPLIVEQYNLFVKSIAFYKDEELKSCYSGYILTGTSQNPDENDKNTIISFIKMANPVTKLDTRRSVIFKSTPENELDTVSDDLLRLYLVSDSIIINKNLYCFNNSIERLFNLEKTLQKVKTQAIEKINHINIVDNPKQFQMFLEGLSSRIFITLDDDRLLRISSKVKRKGISSITGVSLDSNNHFVITTKDDVENLVKYLCLKTLKEAGTNYIYESNSIVKKN